MILGLLIKGLIGLFFLVFTLYITIAVAFMVIISNWQIFTAVLVIIGYLRWHYQRAYVSRQTGQSDGKKAAVMEPVRAAQGTSRWLPASRR